MIRSIWYHCIILDIFRPFVLTKPQHVFSSQSPSTISPEAVFAASVQQLKRLTLVYMARHRSATYTIFWHPALLYIANAVLKDKTDPEWRFYFLLCVRGYMNLYPCFSVVQGIVQGLLAIAVGTGSIDNAEAHVLIKKLRANGSAQQAFERSRGDFVLDLDLAVVDHNAALFNNLVDKFEEMSMFNTFTVGVF